MSEINYQALREAAEKATPGRIGDRIDGSGSIKYECHGYDGSLVLRTDHKNMEYGFIGDNGDADELFFRLCVPDVILALLDELEAVQKTSAARLEAIDRTHKMFQREKDRADAAEKRIAELEALEVTLPEPFKLAKSSSGLAYYYADEVDAAIRAAGIGVKGE